MKLCKSCKEKPLAAGSAITQYICPHCLKTCSSSSTYHPRLCYKCADELNRCQRCCTIILGGIKNEK
jgi:hypothetical protein